MGAPKRGSLRLGTLRCAHQFTIAYGLLAVWLEGKGAVRVHEYMRHHGVVHAGPGSAGHQPGNPAGVIPVHRVRVVDGPIRPAIGCEHEQV